MNCDCTLEEMQADYDWRHAFHEAVEGDYGPGYDDIGPVGKVVRLIACSAGVNDELDWLAVGEWDDGNFFVLSAGCDYTGWDCQSSGYIEFHDSEGKALTDLTPKQAQRLGVQHDANK